MNGEEGSNQQGWQSQPPQKVCRGVRGATTVDENSREAIVEATRQLLETITRLNDMDLDDIASVYFTTTTDLDAAYPAVTHQLFQRPVCGEAGAAQNLQSQVRIVETLVGPDDVFVDVVGDDHYLGMLQQYIGQCA